MAGIPREADPHTMTASKDEVRCIAAVSLSEGQFKFKSGHESRIDTLGVFQWKQTLQCQRYEVICLLLSSDTQQ
jgi:hypothetical protein